MQGRGETGDPLENPPSSGIVRHNSHLRKSRGDPAGNRTRRRVVLPLHRHGPFFDRQCTIVRMLLRVAQLADESLDISRSEARMQNFRGRVPHQCMSMSREMQFSLIEGFVHAYLRCIFLSPARQLTCGKADTEMGAGEILRGAAAILALLHLPL
ncbi:hypothetical protein PR048_003001 [Dryococelus australis]|uniref:Uncharacterized protein n=1 Tax=Dryococelus australis TaxID=614101 RepID=A0ABQ9IMC8_9NEOP|nr:hypothetical protein PR048_003001 [Dryococelus australis]